LDTIYFWVIAILVFLVLFRDNGRLFELARRLGIRNNQTFPLAIMFININLRYSKTVEYIGNGGKHEPPHYILDAYLHGYLKAVFQEAWIPGNFPSNQQSKWAVKVLVNSIFHFNTIDWRKNKFLYLDRSKNKLDKELYRKGLTEGSDDFIKASKHGEASLSLANHLINLSELQGDINQWEAKKYKAEIENSKQALTIIFREFEGFNSLLFGLYDLNEKNIF
jgi:hypothetical protein